MPSPVNNPGASLGANTFTGVQTLSGASVIDANASIAAHATTMNPWSLGNYVTLTGAAVTFTALANAPQAGAEVELYMNAAHTFTDGAVFEVDGNANWTAVIGSRVRLRAKSTTLFTVQPIKEDGTAVVSSAALSSKIVTGTRDNTLADGTQAVTGAGFKPTACICFAVVSGVAASSWGFADSAVAEVMTDDRSFEAAGSYGTAANIIRVGTAVGTNNSATVSTWDADGCTLSWAKAASPTGTTTFNLLFLK